MIDNALIKQLAALSKISFTDDELEKVRVQMSDIVALMDKVKEFDGEENTYRADAVEYLDLRRDNPSLSPDADKILSGSENTKDACFTVPKMI